MIFTWNGSPSLRDQCPGIAITADALVGFPGETPADFEQTLELIQSVQFDDLFSFKYSDRPPARASHFPDKIPEAEKSRRLSNCREFKKGSPWTGTRHWRARSKPC